MQGDAPDSGVVDRYHRVFGHPGLHVVDGSTVSRNLGVNPALTIAAQAERAMADWPTTWRAGRAAACDCLTAAERLRRPQYGRAQDVHRDVVRRCRRDVRHGLWGWGGEARSSAGTRAATQDLGARVPPRSQSPLPRPQRRPGQNRTRRHRPCRATADISAGPAGDHAGACRRRSVPLRRRRPRRRRRHGGVRGRRAAAARGATNTERRSARPLRHHQRQRPRHGLSDPRSRARRLRDALVLRVATDASERAAGFVPARDVRIHEAAHEDHRRCSPSGSSSSTATASRCFARRLPIGAPATPTPTGRYYVNQRLIAVRSRRAVGPGRGRHLGVLRRSPGVDPGRADRHPRHERPVVDRPRGLSRLRPPRRTTCCAGCSTRPMRERLSSSRPDTRR